MKVLPQNGVKPSNPLPKTNSRWGHPTPQKGVEVERKWKRADYKMPGSQQLVQITLK
jgi:formate dehydrogenase major subunit